ncbi:xaa-Arg dipeptidase [Herpailurus yagouaroundi]|uniref:Xaa-Arg dipeptidase n=3 Tax=Felinae TaxID=338152 RepID=A0ABI7XM68_FELCA|nr:peptidase M20 domain-containing protein 2 [Felis catus]XP_025781669.1 peptidase M20 domain-containing protein 2 [Puma concolor]XP_026913068.1 xaa-Arg dipeptidase [Acinonyx jubatus]XP_040330086.1 peptidase M20 domain-containing protein 2 [Puma yagouaroundi]
MRPGEERPLEGGACSGVSQLELLKLRAAERIDEAAERLGALSRAIWSEPELAYEEHRAHGVLTRFFEREPPAASWAVQPHYQLATAFRAEWEPLGVRAARRPLQLGFLCEYDALPGIGHACGHNLIAEVGAAAALGVKGALEGLPGPPPPVKVVVLGTPAEEDGGGKIDLIEAGAFKNLDVVFMAHPSQENAAYLPDVAEHDVIVKYYGKASHAAAYPWEGVNALDAAVLAYNNLSVLRQQMKPTWRVHGIIKSGGVKPNIIPSYSELIYYFRAPSMKELPVLTKKAEDCFRAAALATGCTVEIKGGAHDYYNVLPNKSLWKAYIENGKKLGIEFISEDAMLNGPSGSTDFGNVTFVVPGIHPYFYIGSNALNHTEQYTEAAGSQEAQFYTLRTAKALAMTALDVIFKPELLERIKEDFKLQLQEEEFLNTVE